MRTSAAVESLLSLGAASGEWRPLSPASSTSSESHFLIPTRVVREEVVAAEEEGEEEEEARGAREECSCGEEDVCAASPTKNGSLVSTRVPGILGRC